MPAERTAMRQVRDVLRLKTAGVAINEIARRVGVASSTVRLTLKRLAAAGLGWPLPAEMTDTALEEQLFTAVGKKQGHRRLAEPVARLLARAGHGGADGHPSARRVAHLHRLACHRDDHGRRLSRRRRSSAGMDSQNPARNWSALISGQICTLNSSCAIRRNLACDDRTSRPLLTTTACR